MVKIRGYDGYGRQGSQGGGRVLLEEGRAPQARSGPLLDPGEAAQGWRDLAQVGETLVGVGQGLVEDQARTQVREILTTLGREEVDFQASWEGRTDDTRFQVADEAQEFYTRKRKEIEKRLNWNAPARKSALDQLAAREERGRALALAHVRRERQVQKEASFKEAAQETSDWAAANWRDLDGVLERIREQVDDVMSSYPPELAALLARGVQDQVLDAALMAAKEADPRQAKKLLASLEDPETGISLLSAPVRERVQDRLDTEVRMLEARERAERLDAERRQAQRAAQMSRIIGGQIADAQAYAASTGEEPGNLDALLAQYAALGEGYADKAAEVLHGVTLGREVHNFLRQGERGEDGAYASLAGQLARVEELRPRTRAGAADALERYELARRELEQRGKRLAADPAAEGLRLASGELENLPARPSMTDEQRAAWLLERSLGIQRELTGLPGRVLPLEQARQLAAQWDAADVDGKLGMLEQLDQYGAHKGAALSEIKAPAGAQLAQAVLGAEVGAARDARLLLTASTAKPGEIPKPPDLTDADIAEGMGDSKVLQAVAQVAAMQPGNAAYQAWRADLQKTFGNAARLTGSTDAARAALDGHFVVIADDEAALFAPRSEVPDPDGLEAALRTRRAQVRQALEWQKQFLEPADWEGRVRVIQERGVWVNAPDGNGFVLLNPGTGRAVTDADGEYFRYASGHRGGK